MIVQRSGWYRVIWHRLPNYGNYVTMNAGCHLLVDSPLTIVLVCQPHSDVWIEMTTTNGLIFHHVHRYGIWLCSCVSQCSVDRPVRICICSGRTFISFLFFFSFFFCLLYCIHWVASSVSVLPFFSPFCSKSLYFFSFVKFNWILTRRKRQQHSFVTIWL